MDAADHLRQKKKDAKKSMQLQKKAGEDENYHLAAVFLRTPVTFFFLSKRLILQENIEGHS